jgi:hypothetical protein
MQEYYKCKSDEYSSFTKGKIYSIESIGKYLTNNPEDWSPALPFPEIKEILDCIENGTNKTKIVKALKQWSKTRK